MSQPFLGLVGSVVAMAISLAFVSFFDFPAFAGPVSFFLLCLIPAQIVMAVTWAARVPFAPRLTQPGMGAALLALNVLVAVLVAPLALRLAGEGVSPPGPIPSHFVIIVVPTTFWLAIMFGGWPFTARIKSPVLAGVALLAASYAITFVLFRVFFNYEFLAGTPAHLASAPRGLVHAVTALVFDVTALAVMFLILLFDLWPFTGAPRLMRQPRLGAVWTLAALAGGGVALWIGVGLLEMDPMIFLTRVTVPFIFGTIIVLNMFGNSLFAGWRQPAKGLLNTLAAAAIGLALAGVYGRLATVVTGPLASGPPGYDYEVWLANALLGVTFPFLIYFAAFFAFWPLAGQGEAAAETVPTP